MNGCQLTSPSAVGLPSLSPSTIAVTGRQKRKVTLAVPRGDGGVGTGHDSPERRAARCPRCPSTWAATMSRAARFHWATKFIDQKVATSVCSGVRSLLTSPPEAFDLLVILRVLAAASRPGGARAETGPGSVSVKGVMKASHSRGGHRRAAGGGPAWNGGVGRHIHRVGASDEGRRRRFGIAPVSQARRAMTARGGLRADGHSGVVRRRRGRRDRPAYVASRTPRAQRPERKVVDEHVVRGRGDGGTDEPEVPRDRWRTARTFPRWPARRRSRRREPSQSRENGRQGPDAAPAAITACEVMAFQSETASARTAVAEVKHPQRTEPRRAFHLIM